MNSQARAPWRGGGRRRAEAGLAAFAGLLGQTGTAAPRMLAALERLHDQSLEIVLVAPHAIDELDPLLGAVRRAYVPNRLIVATTEGPALDALARRVPVAANKRALRGRPTAFVCEQTVCKRPTSDPVELARQLRETRPLLPDRSSSSLLP